MNVRTPRHCAALHECGAKAIAAAAAELVARKPDIPGDFFAALFSHADAGGSGALPGAGTGGTGRGRLGVPRPAQAGAAKLRFEADRRRGARDLGAGDRQRRHAVPGRFGDGRAQRAGRRHRSGRASGLPGRAQCAGDADQLTAAAPAAAQRESFIHIHVERHRGRTRRRAESCGAGAGARRRARLRAGLASR